MESQIISQVWWFHPYISDVPQTISTQTSTYTSVLVPEYKLEYYHFLLLTSKVWVPEIQYLSIASLSTSTQALLKILLYLLFIMTDFP